MVKFLRRWLKIALMAHFTSINVEKPHKGRVNIERNQIFFVNSFISSGYYIVLGSKSQPVLRFYQNVFDDVESQ